MPEAGFKRDTDLPVTGGKYLRLKAKGDKIKFLIANTPHYETKHWTSERENVLCDRYNGQGKKAVCVACVKYRDLLALAGDDKEKIEIANKLKPQVTFYYPVLDLKTDEPVIFQTSPSVHWTIVGYKEDGVDVFACAWAVERTEEPGKYYEVRRLDAVKLSTDQEESLARAKQIVLSKGQASSSVTEETDEEEEEE